MSHIDDLIRDLCPDGVEYKALGEIADVGTGNSNREDATSDGQYPFFVRSKEVMRINTYAFDEDAIIIPGEGGIGEIFHCVSGKYALHQRAYRIHFLTDEIETRFAYFYMTRHFKAFILQKAVNATVTSLRKPMIEEFPLPVPPLQVQRAIIEVLDKFIELEVELEAELEARRKQYAHYRDELLKSKSGANEAIGTPLGSVAKVVRGKFSHRPRNDPRMYGGEHPFVQTGDVAHAGKQLIAYKQTLSDDGVAVSSKFPRGTLVMAIAATIGEVAILDFDAFFPDSVVGIVPNEKATVGYLYHLLSSRKEELIASAPGSAQANLNVERLNQLVIPVPPLEEQQRIVEILDRFDALVNDISVGLPAEIAARRKQYEYYRDKLLTFTHEVTMSDGRLVPSARLREDIDAADTEHVAGDFTTVTLDNLDPYFDDLAKLRMENP